MKFLLLSIGLMWIGYLFSFVIGFNPQLMLVTEFLIYNELAEKSTGGNMETVPSNLEKPTWDLEDGPSDLEKGQLTSAGRCACLYSILEL
jgi:hypothetical protein